MTVTDEPSPERNYMASTRLEIMYSILNSSNVERAALVGSKTRCSRPEMNQRIVLALTLTLAMLAPVVGAPTGPAAVLEKRVLSGVETLTDGNIDEAMLLTPRRMQVCAQIQRRVIERADELRQRDDSQ